MESVQLTDIWGWIDDQLRRSDVRRQEFAETDCGKGGETAPGVVLIEYGFRRAIDELMNLLGEIEEIPSPEEAPDEN